MTRAYCTIEDVQARIRAGFNDRDLESVIDAITVRIEQETGRVFEESTSEDRTFTAIRDEFCGIDDLLTCLDVTWEGATVDESLYSFKPGGSRTPKWAIVGPWYADDDVIVTGTWGFSASVPADIKDVCIAWVIRCIKAADGGYVDASAIPELGQLVYAKAIPADVRRVLDRYRRVTPV